jgi:lipopolysaccharide/colanic/teichoic acid biosynthesis glycosyltransferase
MKKFDPDQPGFGLYHHVRTEGALDAHAMLARASEPFLEVQSEARNTSNAGALYRHGGKRIFETLLIIMSLPFFVPVMTLCAIALWIEGGNPFYRQDRLGRTGKRFSILKLRTMVRDADTVLEDYLARDPQLRREWDEKQKLINDPRVTRVGAVLRSTSLDELPQLWNVVKGEMSLIGPRPMLPDQLPMYGNPAHYFALRPGITGLWQISARNGNRFSFRNEVDAAYDRKLSLLGDVAIMFKTVGVMLRRTGC